MEQQRKELLKMAEDLRAMRPDPDLDAIIEALRLLEPGKPPLPE